MCPVSLYPRDSPQWGALQSVVPATLCGVVCLEPVGPQHQVPSPSLCVL